jgi:hypothetical protein
MAVAAGNFLSGKREREMEREIGKVRVISLMYKKS